MESDQIDRQYARNLPRSDQRFYARNLPLSKHTAISFGSSDARNVR